MSPFSYILYTVKWLPQTMVVIPINMLIACEVFRTIKVLNDSVFDNAGYLICSGSYISNDWHVVFHSLICDSFLILWVILFDILPYHYVSHYNHVYSWNEFHLLHLFQPCYSRSNISWFIMNPWKSPFKIECRRAFHQFDYQIDDFRCYLHSISSKYLFIHYWFS